MTRIFFTLAIGSVVLMAAALFLGLGIGDLYDQPDSRVLRWATVHRLTGIAAALSVVFVHSIVVTYFIGTSRWCKEVAETYALDRSVIRRSAVLKRCMFPWSLTGMLSVVGIIALGAASDPATGRPDTAEWTAYHFAGAIVGLAFIIWTYVVAWNNIYANHELIQHVMDEVHQIRRSRGLDVEGQVGAASNV